MNEDDIEQINENMEEKEELTKASDLKKLPIHAIRTMLKDKGIKFSPSDKKADLVKMLLTGETKHKPKEVKRMPVLKKSEVKVVAMLPKEIEPQIEAMQKQGMSYTINEDDCTVTFVRDITSTANLDQSANNILRAAQYCFAKARTSVKGRGERPPEWA